MQRRRSCEYGYLPEEWKSLTDSIVGKLDSKLEVLSSRLTRMVLTAKTIFEVVSGATSPRKEQPRLYL